MLPGVAVELTMAVKLGETVGLGLEVVVFAGNGVALAVCVAVEGEVA